MGRILDKWTNARNKGFQAPRELPTNWKSVLDDFRELGLRRWKRNLMTSLSKWLRNTHSQWREYQAKPSEYVEYHSTPLIYKLWCYKWSPKGKHKWTEKGRKLMANISRDVTAGRECVWRGVGKNITNRSNVQSWWE